MFLLWPESLKNLFVRERYITEKVLATPTLKLTSLVDLILTDKYIIIIGTIKGMSDVSHIKQ